MVNSIEQKETGPCGGFTLMYDCMCEYHELPYRDEVAWVSDIILSYLYEYGIFTVKKEVK